MVVRVPVVLKMLPIDFNAFEGTRELLLTLQRLGGTSQTLTNLWTKIQFSGPNTPKALQPSKGQL
jgi:hypothetical protein